MRDLRKGETIAIAATVISQSKPNGTIFVSLTRYDGGQCNIVVSEQDFHSVILTPIEPEDPVRLYEDTGDYHCGKFVGRLEGQNLIGIIETMAEYEEAAALATRGTWFTHINRGQIDSNTKHGTNQPPVRFQRGRHGKPTYAHEVELPAGSRLVYSPHEPILPCGARLVITSLEAPRVIR